MNAVQDSKLLELINQEVPESRMVDSPVFVLLLPLVFMDWAGEMCREVRPALLATMVQAASANERRYLCKLVKARTIRRFHLWKLRNRLRMIERRKQDRAAQRILLAGWCK